MLEIHAIKTEISEICEKINGAMNPTKMLSNMPPPTMNMPPKNNAMWLPPEETSRQISLADELTSLDLPGRGMKLEPQELVTDGAFW